MAFPVFQRIAKGGTTGPITPVAFSTPNGSGNGIILAVFVNASAGTVTAITAIDNNGNVYTPVGTLATHKTNGYQIFQAANIKVTPNATISITISATFSGGSLSSWQMSAGEWNNVNNSNIVSAFNLGHSPPGPVTLTSQPAGTTAVGISYNYPDTNGSGMLGPPTWTFIGNEVGAGMALADSENFSAGTVSYRDQGSGTGTGAFVGVLVLNASIADNTSLPFLGSVSETAVAGLPTNYIGHVKVITVPRAGVANPYIGNIKKVATPPAGSAPDNFLGEVVIVSGPPAGFKGNDTYLGNAEET